MLLAHRQIYLPLRRFFEIFFLREISKGLCLDRFTELVTFSLFRCMAVLFTLSEFFTILNHGILYDLRIFLLSVVIYLGLLIVKNSRIIPF